VAEVLRNEKVEGLAGKVIGVEARQNRIRSIPKFGYKLVRYGVLDVP
jgi:hypothetical protein